MKVLRIDFVEKPKDLACDSVQVRALTEPDPGEEGGHEYAYQVTTIKFITDSMAKSGEPYYAFGNTSPVLIVPRLDHDTVLTAVQDDMPIHVKYCRPTR